MHSFSDLKEARYIITRIQSIALNSLKTPNSEIKYQEILTLCNQGIHSIEKHKEVLSLYFSSKVKKQSIDLNSVISKVVHQFNYIILSQEITIELKLEALFSLRLNSFLIENTIYSILNNILCNSNRKSKIEVLSYEKNQDIFIEFKHNPLKEDKYKPLSYEDIQQVLYKHEGEIILAKEYTKVKIKKIQC